MFQAIDMMSNALSWQVGLAARELVDLPNGARVVVSLIARLNAAGGDHTAEGARVAWETRNLADVRQSIMGSLKTWIASDDLAVLSYAELLASELGGDADIVPRKLPGFYSLLLPPDPMASKFDCPTGFSASRIGLWTEDTHTWTWPLETPLKVLSDASRFDLSSLRRRTGELMRRNGGRSAFGPEAVEAQIARFRRLNLEIVYRRLSIAAAFRAVREVAGELVLADELDRRSVSYFLAVSGGAAPMVPMITPSPRPTRLSRPVIVSSFGKADTDAWLKARGEGASWPKFGESILLASAASFGRISFRRELAEEHLMLLSDDLVDGADLDEALWKLPQIIIVHGLMPLYEGIAPGGIASVRQDIAGSVPDMLLTLCPALAKQAGLVSDPREPFSFVDCVGRPAVRSIWWRDGGIRRHGGEHSVRGNGCVITATTEMRLRPNLGKRRAINVWRHALSDENPSERQSRSYRDVRDVSSE